MLLSLLLKLERIKTEREIRVMITIQYNSTFHKNNIEMWLYTQTWKKLREMDLCIYSSKWQVMISGQKKSTSTRLFTTFNRTEADWKTCAPLLRDCLVLSCLVVSNIFYFHSYLGKISYLTNIFQGGWNHQLVRDWVIDASIFENWFRFLRTFFFRNCLGKVLLLLMEEKSCTTWDVWNSVNNGGIYHINR